MKTPSAAKFWFFFHAGILGFSALTAMLMKYLQTGDPFSPTVAVAFCSLVLMSSLIGYLAIYLVKRAEKFSHPEMKHKILSLIHI